MGEAKRDIEWKKDQLAEEMNQRRYLDIIEAEREGIVKRGNARHNDRRYIIEETEKERLDAEKKANEAQIKRDIEINKEEHLLQEIGRVKQVELCALKLRQQLRQSSPELKHLESQLRAAYINKTLKAQLAEREAMRLEEKLREKKINETLQAAWLTNDEYDEKVACEDMMKKMQYKQELHNQIIFKEHEKQCAYEDFIKERKLMDSIVERIHDEDRKIAEEKFNRMQRSKKEMEEFMAARATWRDRDRKRLEEDDKRTQELLQTADNTAKLRELEKKKKAEEREKLVNAMGRKTFESEIMRKEKDDIIIELIEEEGKEAEIIRQQMEFENELQRKKEMKETLMRQMKERQEQLEWQAEQDRKYKEQLIAKIMEDEKIEQMTKEKKRIKMIEVRKSIEQCMLERQQQRAEELQRLLRLKEIEEEEENERLQTVEEERKRMLKEHAPNLVGFLPRGIIKPSDLSYLGTDHKP